MAVPTKWLHVLGGGLWQLPTIRLAKTLGYRTLVTDMHADCPGYALADRHEQVDITDRAATLEAARRHRVDGIICDTTDVGVPTMAYVAEQLGLPGIGYETALNFTNKHRMRTLSRQAGVPNPEFELVRTSDEFKRAARRIGWPVVGKPVDSQSSRGVHIIRRIDDLDGLWPEIVGFSRTGGVMVESFLDGIEVTVEGMAIEGEAQVIGVSDKDHFPHRPTVANRLTYPADLPLHVIDRIVAVNRLVVHALGLKTGVTHGEYIVTRDDVYLVEIAARGAGSYVYSHIVPFLAGIPVPELYLRFAMGEMWQARPLTPGRAANLAFFDFPSGRVERIEGLEEAKRLPGVETIFLDFSVGDRLAPPTDDRSRHGLAVVFGRTRQEVLERTADVFRLVQVRAA